MAQKENKQAFVTSFENASILRKFTILFLLSSITPMVLLYYFYVQSSHQGHVGIASINFRIAMMLMVSGVLVGYVSIRSLLKKVINISKENRMALESVLSPETIKDLDRGENEIVVLSRSFSVVTQQLEAKIGKLKAMYDLQKDFTATVSHELRTPLASINMALDLVASQTVGTINGEQKDILSRAQQETERLKRLIDDILYLSKMEADKLQMNFMTNDIRQVITSVVETQKYVAKKQGLYLKAEFDPEVSQAFFDRDRIAQVMNNFLNNAIKFTSQGGIIVKIQNKPLENCILVSISDTGKGIARDDLSKLFQKFQQIKSSHENKDEGTGLGLAICKEIIVRHDGKIWVESKLGEGTIFNFTLPVQEKKPVQISDFNTYSHD